MIYASERQQAWVDSGKVRWPGKDGGKILKTNLAESYELLEVGF